MEKVYKDPSETVKSVVMRAKGIASDSNSHVNIVLEDGIEVIVHPDSTTMDTEEIIYLKEAVKTYKQVSEFYEAIVKGGRA